MQELHHRVEHANQVEGVQELLTVLLLKDGRIDELKQSTEDEVLRDKLMKEYKVR